MKRQWKHIGLWLLLSALVVAIPALALTIDQILNSVYNSTDTSLNVTLNAQAVTTDMDIGGDLTVDTDVLSVDSTNDIVEVNGWYDNPYAVVATQYYTLNAATKANYHVINYTDTGSQWTMLDTDATVDGRVVTIKDGELNASNANIVISTEGAETIDEADTYTIDADGEAVTLLSDGTNWFVINGYLE